MSKLLRRPTRVECFYCSTQLDPRNPRNFRCYACGCWNRYDANGEIMSDEPAMHDEKMNMRSFAKRASPRKDRLPTDYGQTVFCRTCQTNQMLIANLLSNYLPPPTDPDYPQRLELLPEYRESVETRYPPVCADCQPAVEEEIKKRNRMARTSALGGFLQTSRGKGKQRQEVVSQEREKLERQLFAWRMRGSLWGFTLLVSLATYSIVLSGIAVPSPHKYPATVLPILTLLSITWTAWDPTYASLRRSQIQGREVRQRGKREYNILQSLAWVSRLVTSLLIALQTYKPTWRHLHLFNHPQLTAARWYTYFSLAFELIVLIRCALVLRLERPPPVRLVEQTPKRPLSAHIPQTNSMPYSRGATPAGTGEPDIFASLTLSNNPVLTRAASLPALLPSPSHPMFGVPSLASTSTPGSLVNGIGNGNGHGHVDPNDSSAMYIDDDDVDENAMDWSPASPTKKARQLYNNADDNVILRPQRFFAPEEPTGLEHLFARTIKLADEREQPRPRPLLRWRMNVNWKMVALWIASVVVPLAVIVAGWRWWETRARLHQKHPEL